MEVRREHEDRKIRKKENVQTNLQTLLRFLALTSVDNVDRRSPGLLSSFLALGAAAVHVDRRLRAQVRGCQQQSLGARWRRGTGGLARGSGRRWSLQKIV